MGSRTLSRRDVSRLLALGLPSAALAACVRDGRVLRSEREVTVRIDAQPTLEGAGVRLRRALGSAALPNLDPFLLLDEIHSDHPDDYTKGFPTHPHRGFETVSYMVQGTMEHRDSLGNHGRLGPGSAQWMTAGRGIIHSEMPQQESGLFWGFQLWVNLPAARKLTKPRYQDIVPARIAELDVDGARVRLVAGNLQGRVGPVEGIVTAPALLDIRLPPRGKFAHALPAGHTAFAYVFEGAATVGAQATKVGDGQLAVLGPGELATFASAGGARLLLLAGQPLGEPIARYGPFVMNTEAELRRAVEDYRTGHLVEG